MSTTTNKQVIEHLTALLAKCEGTGSRVLVLLQDDPICAYSLRGVEGVGSHAESGVALRYSSEGSEGSYSTRVSAEEEPGARVKLTPQGIKGRDEDGELVELVFVEGGSLSGWLAAKGRTLESAAAGDFDDEGW